MLGRQLRRTYCQIRVHKAACPPCTPKRPNTGQAEKVGKGQQATSQASWGCLGHANCLCATIRWTSEKEHGMVDFRDRFDWVDTARFCHGGRTQQIIPAMVLDSRSRGSVSAANASNPRWCEATGSSQRKRLSPSRVRSRDVSISANGPFLPSKLTQPA